MKIADIETFDEFQKIVDSLDLYSLEASWVTGGMSGGDCWGASPSYSVTAESEPQDTALDAILEEVCPTLTFLQWRRLMRESVYEYGTSESYEYYGNYTIYATRKLDLPTLYRALREIVCDA